MLEVPLFVNLNDHYLNDLIETNNNLKDEIKKLSKNIRTMKASHPKNLLKLDKLNEELDELRLLQRVPTGLKEL
jgi:uncharacterized membrane protein (DUF106 family)